MTGVEAALLVMVVTVASVTSFHLPKKLDRQERQATLLGSVENILPNAVDGQNLTLGGFSGASVGSWGGQSGEFYGLSPNMTAFIVGQILDLGNNRSALLLNDRKKRQIQPVLAGQVVNAGVQLGMAGVSAEALSVEGMEGDELPLMSQGQAVDVNAARSILLGDRKKRQVPFGFTQLQFPTPLQIPTQTISINGQNFTIAGGMSFEAASFGSGELVLNSNGTFSLLQPTFTGQAVDINNAGPFLFGDRKKRQATLGQGTFTIPTQTLTINGQNVTVAGGLSGMSLEAASYGSGELVMNSNGTFSLLQPTFTGPAVDINNAGPFLFGDRKKRQATLGQGTFTIPTQTLNINGQNVTLAGGLSGMSLEAASYGSGELVMNSNGTFSLLQPSFTGQAVDINNAGPFLFGDRKKRQATLGQGTFTIPTQTFTINGQNVTVAGGLSGMSLEAASFGSGELVLNSNGTVSLLQPTFTGQAVDINNAGPFLFGDRKKRQATLGQGTFTIPTQTFNINGQNVTVAGGLSGMSLEAASFGSGELIMNSNGTFSLLQPTFTGQAVDINNAGQFLFGDRKKRQATLGQGTFTIPTQTFTINGQNVTVAGGFSGMSLEAASFGSGELVLNSNGTVSLLQPTFTGQAVDINNAGPFLFGDRKKRQATLGQGTFTIPTQTFTINGQNVTVAGGLSGMSLEAASYGSGELVLNSNGTVSLLQPTFPGQAVDINNAGPFLFGDRKKRQATLGQGTFTIPTQTFTINGQNVTVAGGLSGMSLEAASFGSGELVLNSNGTFSLLQPTFTGQAVDINNAGPFLFGDRKKRQVSTIQGLIPFGTRTIDIGGENVTLFGSLSLASGQSLETGFLPQGRNFTLLGQTLNLGQVNLQQLPVNSLTNLLLGDRKKRQANNGPVAPEDLVLTAAAIDVQTRTLFPGTVDGDDGMMGNTGFAGFGDDVDGDADGGMDENICVCTTQLCASWANFIDTCRIIQSNSECVAALEQLIIIECPDNS